MITITLKIDFKITDSEYRTIDNAKCNPIRGVVCPKGFMLIDDNEIEIINVEQFRKFLNDEIGKIVHMSKTAQMYSGYKNASFKELAIAEQNLKSILSKLNKIVIDYTFE